MLEKKTVEEWLNEVDYSHDPNYVPSDFALEFVNFIKLVNGSEGEEDKTPVIHYKMLDNVIEATYIANLCARGLAKTTIFGEYMILYIAVFGSIPSFGEVSYALYVSDTMDNGVKKMRNRLERRWLNSKFLQEYVPTAKFTDNRWYFKNANGKEFVVGGYGSTTGIRGTAELNTRPQLAILDDLVSDADARSPTAISNIEDTVDRALTNALHPKRRKVIWNGTPFNANDPLYKAIESGTWAVNVYPVADHFPCTKEEFNGAWEDRFGYEFLKFEYDRAVLNGKVDAFNQELMLRIMSDEDRLILDTDITWYKRETVLNNKGMFNFYITTDFATTASRSGDFSVISVWAYNSNGDWLWVDGICRKQLMDQNIADLFRLAQMYKPQSVGIEVSGQQGGFISWINDQMMVRNNYFNLASENNNGKAGIRPVTDKMQRFNVIVPMFKTNKIKFPIERKDSPEVQEAMTELTLASKKGFKSKHDDFIDTISMLTVMNPWKPSADIELKQNDSGIWEADFEEVPIGNLSSYIV